MKDKRAEKQAPSDDGDQYQGTTQQHERARDDQIRIGVADNSLDQQSNAHDLAYLLRQPDPGFHLNSRIKIVKIEP